jgi:hypothetical protein
MAIDSVTVGSRPSGTFATMMPIAKTRPIDRGRPMNLPMTNTASADGQCQHRNHSAECGDLSEQRRRRIDRRLREVGDRPNAVCIAVANTSAVASPLVTDVPASRTLRLAQHVGFRERCVSRDTGRASPVIVALLTRRRTPRSAGSRRARRRRAPRRSRRRARSPPRDHRGSTVAQDSDLVRKQTLQRRHRFLGRGTPARTKSAVDHNDSDDGDGERRHALTGHSDVGEECEERRDPQQDGEEVRELADEARRSASSGEVRCGWRRTRDVVPGRSPRDRPAGELRSVANASSSESWWINIAALTADCRRDREPQEAIRRSRYSVRWGDSIKLVRQRRCAKRQPDERTRGRVHFECSLRTFVAPAEHVRHAPAAHRARCIGERHTNEVIEAGSLQTTPIRVARDAHARQG